MTTDELEDILKTNLDIEHLQIIDDTAKHRNHPQAQAGGGGHFSVIIVSKEFDGKSPVARHRQIFHLLKPVMGKDIHALSLKTYSPSEWKA